jgi:hypothetical protein
MKKLVGLLVAFMLLVGTAYAGDTVVVTPLALDTSTLSLYNDDIGTATNVEITYSFFTFDGSKIFVSPVVDTVLVQPKSTVLIPTPNTVKARLNANRGYTIRVKFKGKIAFAAYYTNNSSIVPLTFTTIH